MEKDIGDIGRADFSDTLSPKQEAAIKLLYEDGRLDRFLNKLSYRFRQGQDKNDLRQEMAYMLLDKPAQLDEVNNLRSWLNKMAVNLCLNDYRHNRVVREHREDSVNKSLLGRMRGGAVLLQRPAVKTPEQQMHERELGEQLEERLRDFIESLPRKRQMVVLMWAEGKSPAEIAEAIGKSDKTVYRYHKEFQIALVERCVAEGVVPDEKSLREVVEDLTWLALAA